MKLYNVVIEVVDLIWADSEQDAIGRFRSLADERGIDPLGDTSGGNDRAFVSEPVDSMGWIGE